MINLIQYHKASAAESAPCVGTETPKQEVESPSAISQQFASPPLPVLPPKSFNLRLRGSSFVKCMAAFAYLAYFVVLKKLDKLEPALRTLSEKLGEQGCWKIQHFDKNAVLLFNPACSALVLACRGSTFLKTDWLGENLKSLMGSEYRDRPTAIDVQFRPIIRALIEQGAATSVITVGHSLGGSVASALAGQWLGCGLAKDIYAFCFNAPDLVHSGAYTAGFIR